MIRANAEQEKNTPWFAKAGAACSIVPISRFVSENTFAVKGGGYGCLFALTGIDEESMTDLELESRVRSIEGALRGLPEGASLHQYTRVMSGYALPRQPRYSSTVTEMFVSDRLSFLDRGAKFRRIDLHWCLTLEPTQVVVQGVPILLVRRAGRLFAVADTCSHFGGPLSEGKLVDNCIECPYHASRFDLEDGHVVNGPAVHPQPCLEVRAHEVQIEVRKTS